MKTLRSSIYIFATVMLFTVLNANAQTSFHSFLNNTFEDTATTHMMTMTFDNSGNLFYAAKGEYQFDDGVNFITDNGIRLWKRSSAGVSSGYNFYKYSFSGNSERVVKMIYTGSALYVLVQGLYDFSPFDRDVILLKYNSSMALQWSRLYNGVGNPHDDAVDLAAGPSGSILMLVKEFK